MNSNNNDDDDKYLGNADLNMTQRFLKKRQRMKEAQLTEKKEVDRKASKNKKIRYIV